jgi:hypothetical protein
MVGHLAQRKLGSFCTIGPRRPGATSRRAGVPPQVCPNPQSAIEKLALFDAPDKSRNQPNRSLVSAQKRRSESDSGTFVAGVLFGANLHHGEPAPAQARGTEPEPSHLLQGTGDCRCDLGVSVMRSLYHTKTLRDARMLTQKAKIPQKSSPPDPPSPEGTANRGRQAAGGRPQAASISADGEVRTVTRQRMCNQGALPPVPRHWPPFAKSMAARARRPPLVVMPPFARTGDTASLCYHAIGPNLSLRRQGAQNAQGFGDGVPKSTASFGAAILNSRPNEVRRPRSPLPEIPGIPIPVAVPGISGAGGKCL